MAITIDGKTYRNLQEQVAANTNDIAYLKATSVDRYTNEEIDEKLAQKQDTLDKVYIHRFIIEDSTYNLKMSFWLKLPNNLPIEDLDELLNAFITHYSSEGIVGASGFIYYSSIAGIINYIYIDEGDIGIMTQDITDGSENTYIIPSSATIKDVVETIIGG